MPRDGQAAQAQAVVGIVGGGRGVGLALHLRGEGFQPHVVADRLEHVARIDVGAAVGDVDATIAAKHRCHVYIEALSEVQLLQCLPRPVAAGAEG